MGMNIYFWPEQGYDIVVMSFEEAAAVAAHEGIDTRGHCVAIPE